MGLFEQLKADGQREWDAYTRHSFVIQLGNGSLPLPAFQDYLVQDYLFLVQFARANALAAYKSRSLADLKDQYTALGAIIAETDLHISLTERWGISPDELVAAPEKQATVAYTRYVLDCGMTGDLLDVNVALAPAPSATPRSEQPSHRNSTTARTTPTGNGSRNMPARSSKPPPARPSPASIPWPAVRSRNAASQSSPRSSAPRRVWKPISGSRRWIASADPRTRATITRSVLRRPAWSIRELRGI